MAEERLIDDDKDRRFKIRKNADGEDELYLDDSPEEDEQVEEAVFEAPEWEDENEEDVLTPEQKAERERLQREADEARKRRIDGLLERARLLFEGGDREGALLKCEEAEEFSSDGEIFVLKTEILTNRFTEFDREELGDTAQALKKNATPEQKAELAYGVAALKERADALGREVEAMNGENEEKKAERRAIFYEKRKKAAVFLCSTLLPLCIFAVLAAVFGTKIHAVKDSYVNLTLTIVFAAIAFAAFVGLLIALNKFWSAQRNVNLNERNSSTKLGRELEVKRSALEDTNTLLSALEATENDIS